MGTLTGVNVHTVRSTGRGSDHYGTCEVCGNECSEHFVATYRRVWMRERDGAKQYYMDGALGDDVCKSCGRTFEEVTRWIVMSPEEKAVTWKRPNLDGWWEAQRTASGTSGADRRARNGG